MWPRKIKITIFHCEEKEIDIQTGTEGQMQMIDTDEEKQIGNIVYGEKRKTDKLTNTETK